MTLPDPSLVSPVHAVDEARPDDAGRVVLVTGGAKRIGQEIVARLHRAGWRVWVHCYGSAATAAEQVAAFNLVRADSAAWGVADLAAENGLRATLAQLVTRAAAHWGRLDALVNNAAIYYPTPLGQVDETDWSRLMTVNLQAPLWLTQAAAPWLQRSGGAIVNIVDDLARPMPQHLMYNLSKAALVAFTRTLARELAPAVRVNGIAPGAILWPEGEGALDATTQADILRTIPLARTGSAADIARAVLFLLEGAPYVSGQILAVDGGRSVFG